MGGFGGKVRTAKERDSELSLKSTVHSPVQRLIPALSLVAALAAPAAPAQDQAPAEQPVAQGQQSRRVITPADPFIEVSHKWDKAVRGFRKGHNFSLLGNYRRTVFQLTGGSHDDVAVRLFAGQLRYAYHIQSDRNVGYYLGSSLGYIEPQASGPQDLEYARFIEFPSLLVGGVFNASSYLRIHTYLEGFLTRLEGFSRNPFTNAIDSTGETIRAGMGVDLFYLLEWGVTFDASYYWSKLRVPKPESDGGHGVESVVVSGNSFAIGLILHLI